MTQVIGSALSDSSKCFAICIIIIGSAVVGLSYSDHLRSQKIAKGTMSAHFLIKPPKQT